MNWNYFIEEETFTTKRLPSPPIDMVKIKDISDIPYLKYDIKHYSNNIEESKEIYIDYFNDGILYEVDVESFDLYFDRNKKNFLNEAKGLKKRYCFIEELLNWGDSDFWGCERNLSQWDSIVDINSYCSVSKKTLQVLENLKIVELKKTSDINEMREYLQKSYTVDDLKKIADKYQIELSGVKKNKVDLLIEAIKNGKIKNFSIEMYRPGKNLNIWLQSLQKKYIEEVENVISYFDYPLLYIVEIWKEVENVNFEFKIIQNYAREQQKAYRKKYLNFYQEFKTHTKINTNKFEKKQVAESSISRENNINHSDSRFPSKKRNHVRVIQNIKQNQKTSFDKGLFLIMIIIGILIVSAIVK